MTLLNSFARQFMLLYLLRTWLIFSIGLIWNFLPFAFFQDPDSFFVANNYLLRRASITIIFNYDLFIFECFFWTLAFGGFWLFNLLVAFILVYWYDSILALFLTLVIILRSVGIDDILRSCINGSSWIWWFTFWESHIIITYLVIVNRFRFGIFIAQLSGMLFVVIDWGGLKIVKVEILLCKLPLNSPGIGASTLIIQTSQTTLQT